MSMKCIDATPNIVYWPVVSGFNFLNNLQIDSIHNYASKLLALEGKILNEDDSQNRKSKVKWLNLNSEIDWLYQHMLKAAYKSNSEFFHMDLVGGETLQYTIYESQENKYKQHIDSFYIGPHDRKLSCTVQLSDPSEYEGGDVKIYSNGSFDNPTIISKEKGSIHFFYSHLIHEVTPVTKGTRKSLVWWISGPSLR